ncbi:MAG: phosphoribosylanthranilate isomerase [Candidatus Omnitrophota bacterium]|nr:phosphoribosylanthranilate isomerase [Candidatus Omnitrophota bacterium]
MTKIKICGITNKKDAIDASELGVDMLGFVFYKKSKRYVEPKIVRDIVNELPPFISRVGVFVNEDKDKVIEIAQECSLDVLQFHADETPAYCAGFSAAKIGGSAYSGKDSYKVIKAFRIKDKDSLKGINDYDVNFYMLDAYSSKDFGGTGKSFDWKMAENFEFLKPVILSGGLTPDNVSNAISTLSPYGVDVSSGIEDSPGRKNLNLMKRFVEKVRRL